MLIDKLTFHLEGYPDYIEKHTGTTHIGEAFPYTVGIDDRGHKSYKRVIVVELTEDGSEAWCELNG